MHSLLLSTWYRSFWGEFICEVIAQSRHITSSDSKKQHRLISKYTVKNSIAFKIVRRSFGLNIIKKHKVDENTVVNAIENIFAVEKSSIILSSSVYNQLIMEHWNFRNISPVQMWRFVFAFLSYSPYHTSYYTLCDVRRCSSSWNIKWISLIVFFYS